MLASLRRVRGLSRWVARAALALLAFRALGCELESAPALIQVLELTPREAELGDRLRVTGVGFPEGKVAHVAFRGDLYRPGVAPVHGVDLNIDVPVVSATELDLPITDATERLFTKAGEREVHTTFAGDVTVAFAARSPAAPPVVGTLHNVWVDFRPASSQEVLSPADATDGERALTFLGIKADVTALASNGLTILGLEPGSRAASANLAEGDVLTEINGLRVRSLRDLVVAPGERLAHLKVRRRGRGNEEVAEISLLGLKPTLTGRVLAEGAILSAAALLTWLVLAPSAAFVLWAGRHASVAGKNRAWLRQGFAVLIAFVGGPSASLLLAASCSLLLFSFPLLHVLGARDLDVGIVALVATTPLATASVLTGRVRPHGARSWLPGLRAGAAVLSLELPLVAAVIAAVIVNGSFGLEDSVQAQGAAPWAWSFFKNPLAEGLVALSFVTRVARTDAAPPLLPIACEQSAALSDTDSLRRSFHLAEGAYWLVMAGTLTALFLGGWQVPGGSPERQSHLGWTLVGGLVFVAKTWCLLFGWAAARWARPPLRVGQIVSLAWRWWIPTAFALTALTPFWVALAPAPRVEIGVGIACFTLGAALALQVGTNLRYLRKPGGLELDPFL